MKTVVVWASRRFSGGYTRLVGAFCETPSVRATERDYLHIPPFEEEEEEDEGTSVERSEQLPLDHGSSRCPEPSIVTSELWSPLWKGKTAQLQVIAVAVQSSRSAWHEHELCERAVDFALYTVYRMG